MAPIVIAVARQNKYDKVWEYWVTVREKGTYSEEHEESESHKSTKKALRKQIMGFCSRRQTLLWTLRMVEISSTPASFSGLMSVTGS